MDAPNILVRVLWFVFFGWWLGEIVLLLAWVSMILILPIPLGLWMLNRLPQVFTLRPYRYRVEAFQTEAGTILARQNVEQRGFLIRALYFVLIGWWLSLIWLELAWVLAFIIVGLPLAFWMFGVSARVATLRRM